MTTLPSISLSLLGRVDLRAPDPDAAQVLLARPKIIALLACLSIPEVGQYVRRERLVGFLWSELEQDRARAALRKAIHAVRSGLGPSAVLTRGDEDLALSSDVECDAAAFVSAIDAGRLTTAVELYRGEFMPGFHLAGCWEFDSWMENERSALAERAAAAAWALAQRYEDDNRLSDAGVLARRAARFSVFDERALRRALRMLDRIGDRAGALRLFDDFARKLRAEMEVEPSHETLELVQQLRGDGDRESGER